jgi:hypothetical protein
MTSHKRCVPNVSHRETSTQGMFILIIYMLCHDVLNMQEKKYGLDQIEYVLIDGI